MPTAPCHIEQLPSSPFEGYGEICFCALSTHETAAAAFPELPPEERLLCAEASSRSRILSFQGGRIAARRALNQAGLADPPPILAGAHREPVWPPGWIGSISHDGEIAAAAAARIGARCTLVTTPLRAIGLDIELTQPRRADLITRIGKPDEIRWCEQHPEQCSLRTLQIFSAKEAVFKALFPLCGVVFGFLDVELQPIESGFTATTLRPLGSELPQGTVCQVRSLVQRSLVVSGAVL